MNGNASVELFILEYINITCSIQVVHPIQGWMEEKLQTYFKRDTECLNHNMWMISCMIISCYCFLMAFIDNSICAAFCSSYMYALRFNHLYLLNQPNEGK